MTEPANDISRKNKRVLYFSLLGIFLTLSAIAAYTYYYLYARFYEETEDAYVNGNLISITPRVEGTVISITADDGDYVEEGQVLVSLDPSDTEVALQNAEANLAKTVRQVRGLYSSASSYQSQVEASKVALERAQADYRRREQLVNSGAISAEELSHARDTLASAKNALASAEHDYDTSLALIDNTAIAFHPDVKVASAQLRRVYLDHSRSVIVAPVSGYVAKRSVQLGNHVSSGTVLMAVVPLDQIWIDANFKESQMREMRIGQPVSITVDLYGDNVHYSGTVESLGIGTGSAFSLLPAQNATGNWIKIVQRLPVRVRLKPDNLEKYPLRIGLSTYVTVDLHHTKGPLLATEPIAIPRFTTSVYEQELKEANALIIRIIGENNAVASAGSKPAS